MKNMSDKQVRVRFAPSPTGELHIGGLKTALFDYLLAKKNNGKFILRIEDTDRNRLVEGAVERVLESLEWAGVSPDEGVTLDGEVGEYGPYTQSKRLDIYKKHVDQLLDENKAYYCFCSSERLDEMRKEQQKQKQAPKYDRHCLDLLKEEIQEKIKNGEKYVVRFKIPEGKTAFEDLVFGKIEVDNSDIDDQIIMKSDGFPTYHLAVVVDDYLMKISHVIRGVAWIPSTPKHVLLYEAFGWRNKMPEFVHMAEILSKNKKKLSKREGSVGVKDFKNQGYSKEALINFIALLGWNPKTEQEIFTMQELIDQFDIAKTSRSGGIFDTDKLDWISAQHIKKMSDNELYDLALPFLQEKEFYNSWNMEHGTWSRETKEEYIKKVLAIEKDRLEKFSQAGEENQFFFSDIASVAADAMRWKDSTDEDTKNNLEKSRKVLENISDSNWDLKNIEKLLLETAGDKRGDLLFPLRAALTGEKRSPSPFEVAWVLGKEKSIQRIKNGIESL
jgi:nondiscriminating glutamyl-tRNA synthetase